MSLLTQKVAHLLSGVSQRPATQRSPSQAEEQVNGYTSLTRGVQKRPPSRHISRIATDTTGWNTAFIHAINRNASQRYHVVVANGTVRVFDTVSGVEVPVTSPQGTAYLADPTGKGFRAVTVGDTTIIVNRGVTTRKSTLATDTTAGASTEALLYIKQADFSTQYVVQLDGVLAAAIRTPDMNTPKDRQQISTEAVAGQLFTALTSNADITAKFVFFQLGSSIHITRIDGSDYTIIVHDGLADTGLVAIKGQLQDFKNLPALGMPGFIVEITGSIATSKDNYWVEFITPGPVGSPGVWQECPKPGTKIALDPTTMPHRLELFGQLSVDSQPHEGPPLGWATSAFVLPVPTIPWWTTLWFNGFTAVGLNNGPDNFTSNGTTGAAYTMTAASTYVVVPYLMQGVGVLAPTTTAYARLYVNGVLADSQLYQNAAGLGIPPVNPTSPWPQVGLQRNLVAKNVLSGDVIWITLEYTVIPTAGLQMLGAFEPSDGQLATLVYNLPHLYAEPTKTITLNATHVNTGDSVIATNYPIGAILTAIFFAGGPGTNFSYTVPDATHTTPSAIATGLAAIIDASAAYAATATGAVITVTGTPSALPTIGFMMAYPTLMFHNDSLSLVPNALVGENLQNLTDGSLGLIASNTANTITVVSLSGGTLNTISPGDVCGVFVDPNAGTHYIFSQIPWENRKVGDTDVVTFPSFMDLPIAEVFFYQDRLGFLSQENIVFSESGNLYNLFRLTATDFLPVDSIDVRSAHAEVTIFDSALLWSGGLYVKSNNVWFRVSANPILTPTTIALETVGSYPSSADPRPVIMGSQAYFTRKKSAFTQVFRLALTLQGANTLVEDVAREIPAYIQGSPLAMAADHALGFLAILTDANSQQNLYVYSSPVLFDTSISMYTVERRQFESWSRWEFPVGTKILGLDMADGILGLIRLQPDGAYLEQIDLEVEPTQTENVAYLDRRLDSTKIVSAVYTAGSPGFTDWTLPYAVPVDGSQGDVVVVDRVAGVPFIVTRPTPTTVRAAGDQHLASVYIGQSYTFAYTPTPLFIRDGQSEQAQTFGRLQLRYATFFYRDTTAFTAVVTPAGRPTVSYTFTSAQPVDGQFKIPVLCHNTDATIVITNSTPGPCALTEIEWEGWYTSRSRHI